jgi:hypothetical protein
MSPELRLLGDPSRTYAALAAAPSRIGPVRALRRPALVAVITGCAVAIATTRHVTPTLVASTILCWSVLVVAQLAIALAVFARPARRTVGIARGIDLFFAGHAPWSLWLLASAAWAPVPGVDSLTPVVAAALVPMALTPRIIAAFCREVLKLDPDVARMRTVVHQAVTWTAILVVYGAAVAILPRALELLS